MLDQLNGGLWGSGLSPGLTLAFWFLPSRAAGLLLPQSTLLEWDSSGPWREPGTLAFPL